MTDINFLKEWNKNLSLKILPLNKISFEELFAHYSEVGFLYPEKLNKLQPHLALIKKNWEKGWSGRSDILCTLIYRDEALNKRGTFSAWKTSGNGWFSQHLTSQNHAAGLLSLLFNAQNISIIMKYGSVQHWSSPTNEFAMNNYGNLNTIGSEHAESSLLNYLQIDPSELNPSTNLFTIQKCTNKDHSVVCKIAESFRSKIYCEAEGLDQYDIELSMLDAQYKKCGLSRKRYIWIAIEKSTCKPRGMIIAYRGPFGFNFSFLENKCDLMLDPHLTQNQREDICRLLVYNASQVYFDCNTSLRYPLKYMVVLTDDQSSIALEDMGAVKTRQYNQSICLEKGFNKMNEYMKKKFLPVINYLTKYELTKGNSNN
ncbi:MAG: hypothetical protein GY760_25645 [Deltaproteobacteria bacterium]|nr:hypothetical protein [Deltaproteobacteria bacterium]